jgi:hypothetical protein
VQNTRITFTATANDAEDGNLSNQIRWTSSRNGNLGTGASIDITTLSVGTHTITARVTDSVNAAVSRTLTVTITEPVNAPPTLSITAPDNNSHFVQNTRITFTATANGAKDGNLSNQIRWTSSRNGKLGTGASINTTTLSVGTHTITARVTDSGGNIKTAELSIVISFDGTSIAPILQLLLEK